MRIVISAGKTGGHIIPALAAAAEFHSRGASNHVLFISGRRAGDLRLPKMHNSDFKTVPDMALGNKLSPRIFIFAFKLIAGVIESYFILGRYRPDVIIGFGGFASAAAVCAARLRSIPVVLHEANIISGQANRLLSRYAGVILLGFEECAQSFPKRETLFVGIPLRAGFREPRARAEAHQYFGFKEEIFTILVTSGSLGARYLNQVIPDALEKVSSELHGLQVLHMTGRRDYQMVSEAYSRKKNIRHLLKKFEPEMKKAYDAADLVISRAGAGTIAEITATGSAAIIVPYPYSADDHQMLNARWLEGKGACEIIEQNELDVQSLAERIIALA
ncbi:MAG: undecaprenyldiphospho-muramoylpentapeptide beta-N-acetylglucosaminyltransferase, partial [Thermoplasmata archaeon]|nr:undecaprenyldiphospho-muramoylpentapeptide beta-N-acetylglucosaminyltransferase [Thermoplasmata archaeon]